MYTSDSLEAILSHLSARVTNVIGDGDGLQHLNFLLEFLVTWEKRPVCLTPMAYEWCSAIVEVAGRLQLGLRLGLRLGLGLRLRLRFGVGLGLRLRHQLRPQDNLVSELTEREFSYVGPSCDPLRTDDPSHRAGGYPRKPFPFYHEILLSIILEIGFRLAEPSRDIQAPNLDHTPHHERMFEEAFSSDDDEVIADAMSVWIADGYRTTPGWCPRYLSKRMKSVAPFSPRLRRVGIRIIERTWSHELKVSGLETVRFLNRLDVDVDDLGERREWPKLLVYVIRSPMGLESLSSHYWRLLDDLVLAGVCDITPVSRDAEVMRSLEEAGEWEKLEVWMAIVWESLRYGFMPDTESMNADDESMDTEDGSVDTGDKLMDAEDESMDPGAEPMGAEDKSMDVEYEWMDGEDESMNAEDVRRVTLKLLLQRPSALPRFDRLYSRHKPALRRICAQVRAEQLLSESLPS